MNRARIAARAAVRYPSTPNRDSSIPLGPLTVVPPRVGAVRRHKARMTDAQRDSTGKRSDWNRSPYVFSNPGWDK